MSEGLYITRRRLCIAAAGMLGLVALGLSGCSSSGEEEEDDPTSLPGFGGLGDTEVKTYPVTLKIYTDSNLQWMQNNPGAAGYVVHGSRLDQFAYFYQSQNYRSDVDFDFVYVDPSDLLEMTRTGFPDGDGVIALKATVTKGCETETIDGGAGDYMVRNLGYPLHERLLFVRAKDSGVEMPAARTLDGEDTPSADINRIQQLPYDFDGLIGIADPATTTEGKTTLNIFKREKLFTYDEGSSTTGTFVEGLAEKIVYYPDEDAAIEALVSGECQLSFALQSALGRAYTNIAPRYPDIEQCYLPVAGAITYHGSALAGAPEPGVMRDFLELMVETTW